MKCKCDELGDFQRKEKVMVNISFIVNTDDAKETIREMNHIITHYSMSFDEIAKVFGVKENDLKWNIKEL